jgi:hypothetical protein
MADEASAAGKETPPSGTEGTKTEPKQDDPPKWVNDIFTRIGRVDAETKKRFDALEARLVRPDPPPAKEGASDELNQKYTEQVLQGNFTGAVDDYMSKRRQAEEVLAKRNQTAMDRIISDMEDAKVPYFGEVKDSIKKTAANLIGQGYSPQDAVAFAYEKGRADHLHKLVSGKTEDFDSASLETSGGGSVREDSGAKKGKLNAEGKKAFEKNKAYFKDEAEFIASMSSLPKQRFVG